MKNRGKIIELSILVVALVLILAVKAFDYYSEDYVGSELNTSVMTEVAVPEEVVVETVQVHIKGEVNLPDVYELAKDSRIKDVIKMAGGFTRDAEQDSVNLAAKIYDTQQITIYKLGEKPVETSMNPIGMWTIRDLNEADLNRLTEISGIGETMAERIISYRETSGPFNSVYELLNISGIGEKKLESIKSAFAFIDEE